MEPKDKQPPFIIDAPATIEWPVTVTHPVDGGELASFCFTGVFKRLSEDELDTLLGADAPKDAASEPSAARMAEVLAENAMLFPRVLVGWRHVTDVNGVEVPFGAVRLTVAVRGPNGPYLSAGLWRAIAEIRTGARLGN